MELGQLLKQARLEAGLSQRQLCGDEITRNMLSLIENGSARPSMDTLSYLAGRLGKPISYFLEEEAVTSPNQAVMAEARLAYLMKDYRRTLQVLEDFRKPDGVFDLERELLELLACLALAESALDDGRRPHAAQLLTRLEALAESGAYCTPGLHRQILLLKGRVHPKALTETLRQLPSLDEELLLRARAALEEKNPLRCGALLEAAEDHDTPDWNYLRGEAHLAQGEYLKAAECYHKAESAYPEKTASRLERCYRELEDFKMAYFYACKQR